jgi:hypothetical protein
MTGVCACCKQHGVIESHHVGRRLYSPICADVCVPCHRILTIWDTERTWQQATDPVWRVALGIIDVLKLAAKREGNQATLARIMILSRQCKSHTGFTIRPSRALAIVGPIGVGPNG